MGDGAKGYNGWANYETWCVHLWLTNEEGSYRYWREEAERVRREARTHANVKSELLSVDETARYLLGEAIKESFETFHPFRGEHLETPRESDVFADLLDAALSEVRWSHVAEAFLEELEPDDDDQAEDDEKEPEASNQGDESAGPLFPVGRVVSTPGALSALTREDIEAALRRHVAGDWGEMPQGERLENETAVREGHQIHSVYRGKGGCRFYVITEADRSVTTVLLPDEY